MESHLGRRIELEIKHIEDLQLQVEIAKARTALGFEPTHAVTDIIEDLRAHQATADDRHNNFRVFR